MRAKVSMTDPRMASKFTRHLACCDVPQNHRFVRAARTNLAVVIGTANKQMKETIFCVLLDTM